MTQTKFYIFSVVLFLLFFSLLQSTLFAQASSVANAAKDSPAKTSALKADLDKKLPVGRAILKELAESREYLMAASFRVQYVKGGRIRVLIMPRNFWERSLKEIKRYRKALKTLAELPLKSFLYHPRAFVEAADALKWGRTNSIALDLHGGMKFGKVIMVLP